MVDRKVGQMVVMMAVQKECLSVAQMVAELAAWLAAGKVGWMAVVMAYWRVGMWVVGKVAWTDGKEDGWQDVMVDLKAVPKAAGSAGLI